MGYKKRQGKAIEKINIFNIENHQCLRSREDNIQLLTNSFTFLKTIAKSKNTHVAITLRARKSNNFTFTLRYRF